MDLTLSIKWFIKKLKDYIGEDNLRHTTIAHYAKPSSRGVKLSIFMRYKGYISMLTESYLQSCVKSEIFVSTASLKIYSVKYEPSKLRIVIKYTIAQNRVQPIIVNPSPRRSTTDKENEIYNKFQEGDYEAVVEMYESMQGKVSSKIKECYQESKNRLSPLNTK